MTSVSLAAYQKITGLFSWRVSIILYYCPNLTDTHEQTIIYVGVPGTLFTVHTL